MVAHLVSLKVALLRNGLRRSAWQVVGLIVGLLYGLGLAVLLLVGLVALAVQSDQELAAVVLLLGGSLLVLGWWVVPLVAFGVDATLDPQRFTTFSVPRRSLLAGLAIAGLVGIPGLVTVLVALTSAVVWWRTPAAVVAGLVGAALAVALCVVGSRATTTALAPLVTRRKVRELGAIAVLIPMFLLGPIMGAVGSGLSSMSDTFPEVAQALGWTPFGAPWALGVDVAAGQWAPAVAKLAIGLVTLAALLWVWDRALTRALTGGEQREGPRAKARGLGWFDRFPATPVGAVAARSLTYWLRDPRYAGAVILVPLVPVLFLFLGGRGTSLLLSAPIAALLFGWGIAADVAYDSTAFWTHVAAPIRGAVDRWGRACAALALGVPATLLMSVVVVALVGRWDLIVPVVGYSLGVLATATGASSFISARVVYPVPKPGENPFSTPQGSQTAAMISQMAGMAGILLLALPSTAVAVAAVLTGATWLGLLAAAVSLALGGLFLVVGVRMGGAQYDKRAPDLLTTMRGFA